MGNGARVETGTLLFHGMVGRGRDFGRDGCTVVLNGEKAGHWLPSLGGQFEEQSNHRIHVKT